MNDWPRLWCELDHWQAAGRLATLWWRDDDACRDSPALQRLLAIAAEHAVPLTVAAIPALLEPSLVAAIGRCPVATVVQHGYAHRDHAPAGGRNWELGGHRPARDVLAELDAGGRRLRADFGARFLPVLVPPWNRIAAELTLRLAEARFSGLSTFGPRTAASPGPGLVQCNAHVDPIAWRKGGGFIGADAAIDRLTGHLEARRTATVDAAEPTGLLTHHLDFGDEAWQFLARLIAGTRRHPAVEWVDAARVFRVADRDDAVISGRST
jgi:hypothetical protein